MSRSYATLDCGIWDPESGFAELSAGAQRTYFMLVSQASIAACGTLALTVRRWSRTCSEGNDIKAWLNELTDARYVLIDEDTEELLVRTFVKWDGGYKHPQRLKAVIATAKAIQSRSIRTAMAEELQRIGLSSPYQVPLESPRTPEPEPGTAFLDPEPQPGNRKPVALALAAPDAPTSQTIVAEWIERSPKRPPGQVVGQVAKLVGQMLAEGIDPDDVRRGLAAWMAKRLHPSTLPSVVNEVMNGPPQCRQSTDDLFDRAAARMEARQ